VLHINHVVYYEWEALAREWTSLICIFVQGFTINGAPVLDNFLKDSAPSIVKPCEKKNSKIHFSEVCFLSALVALQRDLTFVATKGGRRSFGELTETFLPLR
jgi:hypothetical protein